MFSDFQENGILGSQVDNLLLPQYSNSPLMVYWNLHSLSYSVAFWGEIRSDFTLNKMWEDSEDEGCALI